MTEWEKATGRLGAGAAWYAKEMGWSVFPCWGIADGKCMCGATHDKPKDNGKHPQSRLVGDGMLSATTDADVIEAWWRADPEANVAVRCRESGLLVVDVDPRSGGHDSLDVLEKETGGLPVTVTALTGSYATSRGTRRGMHQFFSVDASERLRGTMRELRGLDFKHDGYVLVSPSRHASGHLYDWEPGRAPWETRVAPAPEALLELLRKGGRASARRSEHGDLTWNGERVDVDALRRGGVPDGERNVTLIRVACSIANKLGWKTEVEREAVRSWMLVFNAESVSPPLSVEEVEKIVDNALDQVASSPPYEWRWPGLDNWLESVGAKRRERETGAGAVSLTLPVSQDDALPPDMDTVDWGDDRVDEDGADDGVLRRSMSDIGNARRIVDYYEPVIRYTEGLGWFHWDGEYWHPDAERLKLEHLSTALPSLVLRELSGLDPTSDSSAKVQAWAQASRSTGKIAAALTIARTDPRIYAPVSLWDSSPTLLGVRNGVIDLTTGDLLPGRPEQHITRRAKVAYTPGMRNLRWEQFLDFATGGDSELADWLQRAAGYTLTGLRTYDVLFIVYGPPGSGKSTLLETLGHMLGDYMWVMDSKVLIDDGIRSGSDEYHWAQLRGRRMVALSELPEGKKTKEDSIKRLTGDLSVSARSPGERPFTFESQAKVWIGTNHRPVISDDAMWRRIRAIPFSNVPERPDPHLKSYLMDPEGGLPAALSWAVEGAVKLLGSAERDALGMCRVVAEATAEYQSSEDRLAMFLDEETRPVADGGVAIQALYMSYQMWCEFRGEKPMTTIALVRKIKDKGYVIEGRGSSAVLKGRSLRPKIVPSIADLRSATII